jgi:hypothetical protein
MKISISTLFLFLLPFIGFSQQVKVLSVSHARNDSSFYDIKRTSRTTFWACGKYGILYELSEDGKLSKVNYPGQGKHLLKMDEFDADNAVLCGEGGFVYNYCRSENSWNVVKVKGYDNSTFYNICVIDANTAYVCGGKSKITRGQRTIPFGFILKSNDKGKTWKEVYHCATEMIWDMDYDKKSGIISALTYSPFTKSRIISSPITVEEWNGSVVTYNYLFHEMFNDEGNLYLAGSKSGKIYSGDGSVFSSDGTNSLKRQTDGLLWDIDANSDYLVSSACKGVFYVNKKGDNKWQRIDTGHPYNLYEIAFIDSDSFFLVGSNKLILKVNLEKGIN